jgi:hypothetical protein
VNALWRVGRVMVKAVRPDGASPLFPNSAADEAEALRRLGPRGLAPRLIAAGADWLAYARVPGHSWRRGPEAAARSLHALHVTDAALPFRSAPSGSAALLAHGLLIAAACHGPVPAAPPDPGVPPPPRPRLIHGDAVAGNLVTGAAAAGRAVATWIDWQCAALGDPAEDLAAFLSPAMQQLYRGRPLAAAETAAFLAAYPDAAVVARYRALAPLLHWRIAVHCLWRAERGAPGYAAAAGLEMAA